MGYSCMYSVLPINEYFEGVVFVAIENPNLNEW